MLTRLADNLWVAAAPLSFLGCRVGSRMTIVRLQDGDLWLHSPVSPCNSLREDVDALGPVKHIVAPSLYHHLHVAEAAAAWPNAAVHGPRSLFRKRPDIDFDAELGEQAPAEWRSDLEQLRIEGTLLHETVFLHPASRTLINADLAANFGSSAHRWTRWYLKANRVENRFALTATMRVCYRDRERARACIDKLLAWDFDRVVVSHGEVLETGGKEAVGKAFAWL